MRIINKTAYPLLFLVLLFGSAMAYAKDFGIVAVVNNDVITNHMLQERITLAIKGSRIEDTPASRARLKLQTLESLIDETLQKQEAKRRGIKVSETEFARSQRSIEKQNNLEEGQFNLFLEKFGLSESSFVSQMKAQLLWQKMVLRLMKPRVFVTTEESDEFAQRVIDKRDQNELLLSEILIPVLVPEQENDAKKLVDQLYEQLTNKDGEFALFASQFSRSSTAKNGGEIGWVSESDIEGRIRNALSSLSVGGVTEPVRTASGYLIMKLNDKRKSDETATPDMDRVRDFLARQKIELEARKFMKDLRRNAYIERRI